MNIGRLFEYLILALVGLMFIIEFAPELETAITGFTGTNTFVIALLGISEWVVPVSGIAAIVVWGTRMIGGIKRR